MQVQIGDTIAFKLPRGRMFMYTRQIRGIEPGGVWVRFMNGDYLVPNSDFKKVTVRRPVDPLVGNWYYLIDIKTLARVSYVGKQSAPMWQLLARLTKQHPARDFGFRSARRRPVGDTVDRLDTETLHLD